MKTFELANRTQIAEAIFNKKTTGQTYLVNFRIEKSNKRNDLNTWTVQSKVMVKGEKWHQVHWFDCRTNIDEVIAQVQKKLPHLRIEKVI